ncbi:SCO family protein [Roseateles sp. BYS180W]|uniref:SCO family protein n=1 Tax=Roseateles rivi TaxID=3299028 RepID=A0ABW7FRZ2_9BURK
MKHRDLAPAGFAVLVLLAVLLTLWQLTWGGRSFTSDSWRRLDLAAHPRALPRPALRDELGLAVDWQALCQRRWVLDFVYTRCTSVCQAQGVQAARMARMLDTLGVSVWSISLEPEVDDAQALERFKRNLQGPQSSSWKLAHTRDEHTLQPLLDSAGVVRVREPDGSLSHNAAWYVVEPGCQLSQALSAQEMLETAQQWSSHATPL